MKGRFAHISDCHIGAWRDPRLRGINDSAFGKAIDLCIEKEVDFVIISGDIFDVGIPEMSSVRSAVRKLRELDENDISTYVVYGSHDYSPTTVSVVDVLTSAGLFVNVGEFSLGGEKTETGAAKARSENQAPSLVLRSIVDEKTGVRIGGLPARKGGLETGFYKNLAPDTDTLEGQYSIFVFHASINELQSLNIPIEQSLSISELPRGFSYYAGGHLHKRSVGKIEDSASPVVYPGPLFGTSYADLELTAKGEKRGFAIVDFEGSETTGIEFMDIPMPKILAKNFSADGKSAPDLSKEIASFATKEELNVRDSIVLLKIKGALSSGRPSDVDWFSIRQQLLSRGALVVNVNRTALASQELRKLAKLGATNREEIESKLLHERIFNFKPVGPELASFASTEGVAKASALLRALKSEKREEETRQGFERRVLRDTSRILGLGDEVEVQLGQAVPLAEKKRKSSHPPPKTADENKGKSTGDQKFP